MLYKGMSKREIQEDIKDVGEYVQIDRLNNFLNTNPPIDIKKFIYLKLADIYEKKLMFNDAANCFNNAALITIAYIDKIKFYTKEAEMHIKSGHFEKVESSMRKAMNNANAVQKPQIKQDIENIYKKLAEEYAMGDKRSHAVKVYEKLLEMRLPDAEKEEVKEKLKVLYQSLGRYKDIGFLG